MGDDGLAELVRTQARELFENRELGDSADQAARQHPMLEAIVREALEHVPGGLRACRAVAIAVGAAWNLGRGEGMLGLTLRESGYSDPQNPPPPSDGGAAGE